MAFSGQAFHWVDQELGFRKLADSLRPADALRPGGTAALFWYTPSLADQGLVDQVDHLYENLAPEIGSRMYQPSRFDDAGGHLRRIQAFGSITEREYRETRIDTSEAWLAMLRTTSDHLALPEERREALLNAIGDAIGRHGGSAEVSVVTRLWLAKRS